MARFTIEIVQRQNEGHIFAPLRERVRGRWDFGNVADKDLGADGLKALAREVRVIPGQYIDIDTEKMKGAIYDPLAETTEGKRTWEVMSRIINQHKGEFGSAKTPETPKSYDLSHDDVKNWLWEFGKVLASNQAQLVSGSDPFPSFEEISRMPGKRNRDIMNTGVQEKDLKKFVDIVPIKESKREAVTAN